MLIDGWTLALAAVVHAYVLAAPFTKVEESFSLQAVHDLLYHGPALQRYDHLEFPGVVSRSFLGALAVAAAAAPAVAVLRALGASKLRSLLAVRLALAQLSLASLAALRRSVQLQFGGVTAAFFMLLTALQFHLPFYMSRPLPNTLAAVLTNLGLAAWLRGDRPLPAVYLLTFATVVLRCDVVLLLGLVGLHMLASRQLGLGRALLHGAAAVAASLAASVLVDSVFWGRWLWPEGEVLYFNTLLNKSSEWGVAPWGWYFTSALPRALHGAYPLALVGAALDRRARAPLGVALGYTLLYSNLGHKELRFLLPVLPLWNVCAAVALQRAWVGRRKSAKRALAAAAAGALLASGAAVGALTAAASSWNYPGGHALQQLHQLAAADAAAAAADGRTLRVHIGVLPAMTGVSRFGEEGAPWVYSKEEGLAPQQLASRGYDFLLTDQPGGMQGYTPMGTVHGFERLQLAGGSPGGALRALLRRQLPLRLDTAPKVWILRRS